MSSRSKQKLIIFGIIMLIIVSLSVGFSAFQKSLYVDDMSFYVRLEDNVRVSNVHVSKVNSSAVSNYEEYNVSKLIANVTLPSSSAYVLYKVDLTNYGNIKSGLLSIKNNTSVNYSICNSNGSSCSSLPETPVCSGNDCTLGATKELYVKVSSNTSGTYDVNLDFDFEPYNAIQYNNIKENISSFRTEVMSNDTYQLTLTSKPEVVEVAGSCTYTYNKNTGVLNISHIDSDLSITAKYLVTKIYEDNNSSNPSNYVRFNGDLYRMLAKDSVSDGYGNTENRVKIIANSSIGNNIFDNDSNEFGSSSLKNVLNTSYYAGLSSDAQDLIDTVEWTEDFTGYVGLIESSDYTANNAWFNKYGFTLTKAENNKVVSATSNGLIDTLPSASLATYPALYLKKDALIVDGNGTENNPYLLEISSGSVQTNPTVITGKNQNVTGSNIELVTVTNKVGTVYYSRSTQLDSENYTDGSTSIPVEKNAGTYLVYYYIPAGENYKAKSGRVTAHINPLTFQITYTKGANVSSIGKQADLCTTSGSSITCSVTLPSITPNAGYRATGWSDGTNTYNVGSSYTLSQNTSLTAMATGDTFVATFNANGATGVGETSLSCTVTTGSTCTVTAPSITREGFTIGGWGTSADATTGVQVGNPITLSQSGTYYAVTSKVITITFNKNGNTSQTPNGGTASTADTLTQTCTIQNNNTNCTVKSPTITTEGFTVIGYSSTADDHTSSWNQNTNKTVDANATYFAQTIKNAKTITITFNKNGNTSQTPKGGTLSTAATVVQSCTINEVYNGAAQATSCNVTSPTIGAPNGYQAVGYSTASDEHTSSWNQNIENPVSENKTYFAQSRKEQSASFALVDTNAATLSAATASCYTYNGDTGTCTVTPPTLTPKSGYVVDGWSTTNGGTTTTTTFTSGNTYYSVTHKGYSATFVLVDANAATLSSTTANCTSYNGATSCTITPPTLTAKSGYTVDGWSTTNGGTTTTTTFTSGNTYYSVTHVTAALTATFNIQDSNAATKSGGVTSCYKYNGASTCQITSPTLTAKTGYAVVGWNTDQTSTESTLNSNTSAEISSNTTYYSITYNTTALTAAFNIQDTNAAIKSGGVTSCNKYNGATSCRITAPTLTEKDGYAVVGWNTDQNATTSSLNSNASTNISSNTTYYSITRTSNEFTAAFIIQDNNAATQSGGNTSCYKYNGALSCEITTPTLTAKTNYTVIGWNYTQSATTATVGSNETINITANITYYSITKATAALTATFNIQDTAAATKSGGTTTCYKFNGATSCQITSPTLTANEGYTVVGWNTNQNSTESTLNSNTSTNISANTTYYSITRVSAPLTATFTIQDTAAATKSGGNLTCYLFNGASSCTITAPTLAPKTGYTVVGWNTDQNATASTLNSTSSTAISANTTYYSITYNSTALTATFNIQDTAAATKSGGTLSCYRYNGSSSCSIVSPTLTAKTGYTAVGWNTNQAATSSSLNSNTSAAISANTTYYSITYNNTQLTATFTIQDTNAATKSGGTPSCYRYNGSDSCNITAPTLTANEGYTAVGWNTSSTATTSSLDSNATTSISSNVTYKSITHDSTPLVATFTIQDTAAATKSGGTPSCYKYNGASSCQIVAPTLTANEGYTALGWNTSSTETISSLNSNESTTISSNTTYYSITIKNNYQNVDTGIYYESLKIAFTSSSGEETIKVLNNVTENDEILNSRTNMKLDLNGKTLTLLEELYNYGSLDIYNSSSNDGVINGESNNDISNYGTLTINNTSSTNNTIIYKKITNNASKTLTIYENTEVRNTNGIALYNFGILTINGGTIYGSNSSINGQPSSTITINGGTIGYTASSGVLTINGGTIAGNTSALVISGTITINGGTFTANGHCVRASGSSTTLTIGNDDSTVSTTYPSIQTNGTSSKYGLYITDGATVNYYDGAIKSASGTGYSIYGTVADMPDGYDINKTTSNGIETAILVRANYQNTTTNSVYETLSDAFNNVSSNQTIKVLADVTETAPATLASTKTGVKLDLNGKTVIVNNNSSAIINNGELDIYNTSSTTGIFRSIAKYVINNTGTLTFNGTDATNPISVRYQDDSSSETTFVVNNSSTGTVTIYDNATLEAALAASINNAGLVNVNGGTLNSVFPLVNNGTVNINGGTVQCLITNKSILNMYGGRINKSVNDVGDGLVRNNSTGTFNVYDGNISVTSVSSGGTLIVNLGTFNMSGGSLSGTKASGLDNSGIATITGGSISSNEDGINMRSGTVTLGTNDSTVSKTSPSVQTTGTSNRYGVDVCSSCTFNFYDGVIKSRSGSGKSINGTVTNIPNDYEIAKTVSSGTETAILSKRNYQNTTTNAYYETLREAFAAVENNQTIRVLNDTAETNSALLDTDKTGIKLDLNGKTISSSESSAIRAFGELDIYNTSNTDGKITSSYSNTITVYGILTINETSSNNNVIIDNTYSGSNGDCIDINASAFLTTYSKTQVLNTNGTGIRNRGTTSVSNITITTGSEGITNSSGTLTVSGSTQITAGGNGVQNYGTFNMNSGTFTSALGSGIYNASSGQLTVSESGGTITLNGHTYGIGNVGTATINSGTINGPTGIDNSGTLTITGGTIAGTYYGLSNQKTLYMSGGNATGKIGINCYNSASEINISGNSSITGLVESGISFTGSGTITGGTITGVGGGIAVSGYDETTLTIGDDDGTISTTTPVIETSGTNSSWGLYISENATVNFYDGVIKSASGTGYSIYGTVVDTPDNTSINKTTVNGVESATLVERNYLNTTTNSYYGSLKDALAAVSNNQTIQVQVSEIHETETAVLASGKTGVKLDLNGSSVHVIGDIGITNNGGLDIYSSSASANLSGSSLRIINNNGTLTLNGTSSTYSISMASASTDSSYTGIYNGSSASLTIYENITIAGYVTGIVTDGDVTMLGGFVTTQNRGITVNATGTLTLGVNDSTVGESTPQVQAYGSSSNYGVYINTGGTLNFYDGVIRSGSGEGYALNGTATGLPTGYGINKRMSGNYELATVVVKNYQNISDGNYHATLRNALQYVSSNETIKVLNNVSNEIHATLDSGKTGVKIDINGKTVISTSSGGLIINNGELDLYNSSSTAGTMGTDATNQPSFAINNLGTLTINGTTSSNIINLTNASTLNNNTVIYNSGSLTVNNNSQITGSHFGINNSGQTTVLGGTVSGGYSGINNLSNSVLTLGTNDSTISTTSPVIQSTGSSGSYGVYVDSTCTVNFYDGVIKGRTSSSINSIEINTANGYAVSKTTSNNIESAILAEANYANITSSRYYMKLDDAFSKAPNNSTIKVLKDTTESSTVDLGPAKTGIKLDLNGKTITTTATYGIDNRGELDIYNSSSTLGTITGTGFCTLENHKNLSLNGTSTTNGIRIDNAYSTGGYALYNTNSSNTSQSITMNNNVIVTSGGTGLYNYSATANILGGTISAATGINIQNAGTVNMSGGNVTGTTNRGIENYGTSTITGGVITGVINGVSTGSNATLTIGTDDETVSTSSPVIFTSGTNSTYGLNIASGSTVNYYDGLIGSASGTGYSIYGDITDIPDGYGIMKTTTEGTEYATLGVANYQNTTTNAIYESLNDAFTAVGNNQTIKVLQNVTEDSAIELASTKTGIKLDLNGKTITTTYSMGSIFNQGELDIYNTSSTAGAIVGDCSGTLMGNIGTLTINGTSSTNPVIIRISDTGTAVLLYNGPSSNFTVNANTQLLNSNGAGLTNYGNFTLNDATVTTKTVALTNENTGNLTINGNSQVTSTTSYGIDNKKVLTITGGTVTGTTGIYNYINGTTVTFGTNDSTVSTTSPVIHGTTSYGMRSMESATINFYDGVLESEMGTGYALYGSVTYTAPGYIVKKETTNGVEKMFLSPAYYQNTTTGAYYETLDAAFSAVSNNQTIKVLNDKTETTAATLGSDKTGIKLDLNGKTIDLTNSNIIVNGELDVYNSSSTAATITGTDRSVISNYNILTINGTSSTNVVNIVQTNTTSGYDSLVNRDSGNTTINSNTNITSASRGIYNYGGGTINVIGGNISAARDGINNQSSGIVVITGGTITSQEYAIYNANILTIGTNDSNVSTTSPVIQTTGNTYAVSGYRATLNFYDGVISSAGGVNKIISGTVNSLPTGYAVLKTTTDGVGTAILAEANYVNTTTNKGYMMLKEAFGEVNNGDTIKVLKNTSETEIATISSNITGAKLDLNGKTITTSANNGIYNLGELDIYNTSSSVGTIDGSGSTAVDNAGTLTLNGTASTNEIIISNTSSEATKYAVLNNSSSSKDITATINNNVTLTCTNGYGLKNNGGSTSTGTATINGGTITSTNNSAISNNGILTINNGTITGNAYGIYNDSYSTLNMINGTVTSTTSDGIRNSSTATISGGSIYGNNNKGITNSGTLNVVGGNINGKNGIYNTKTLTVSGTAYINGTTSYGIYNTGSTATTVVTGGTIDGVSGGILAENGTTVTLGIDDTTVSTTSPVIRGLGTSSSRAVYVYNGGIFNFYDGILSSASGTYFAIYGAVADTPTGYIISTTTTNGVETAILVEANYTNITRNKGYATLAEALGEVDDNETIKVLKNTTETSLITLGSKNGVKLDLNGKTITSTSSYAIINNGELDIYNSSSTDATISCNQVRVIQNYGTLTLNGTSSSNNLNIINNSTNSGVYGIYNDSSGSITVNDNVTISCNDGTSLNNSSSNGDDGIIVINGGTITSIDDVAVDNGGIMTINNAIITSTNESGLESSGTMNIYGGTISGGSMGIRVRYGITTLGTNNSTVSTTSPSIAATQTGYSYGIYIQDDGTLNFYDGVISSNGGTNKAIYGSVADTPTGYTISKTTTNGVETAILVEVSYQNTTSNVTYGTLNDAFAHVQNGETIQVTRNVTETSTATLPSGKSGVKLDLNGKTITTSAANGIRNNGGLDIYNSSSTTGTITDNGTNSDNGVFTLSNNGTLTINATDDTNTVMIKNTSPDMVTSSIYNTTAKTLTVNDNVEIDGGDYYAVMGGGTVTVNDATITSNNIAVPVSGTYTFNDTTINSQGVALNVASNGIANINGNSQIYGKYGAIENMGTVNITNGTLSSNATDADAPTINNHGVLTITGGTITGIDNAIDNNADGTLTLGTNDSTTSNTSPLIVTTGTPSKYGVYNEGTFNFYDGKVESASGTGYGVYGTINNQPSGYQVSKTTVNGEEIVTLIATNYQNTTTNNYYETLSAAFSNVANNQTIKVLNNVTETTVASLASTKSGIKLDLNGKTITFSVDNGITNSGTLDIYNTSGDTGFIEGYGNRTILNAGTLTLNGTSSSNKISIQNLSSSATCIVITNNSSKTLTMNNNTDLLSTSGRGVVNHGTFTMNNKSTIQSNAECVNNQSSGIFSISGNSRLNSFSGNAITQMGTATIAGGIITGNNYGIYTQNGSTTTIGINDSTVSTSNPSIETLATSSRYALYIYSGATVNFYDGVITSYSGTGYAIYGTVNQVAPGYTINYRTIGDYEKATLGT